MPPISLEGPPEIQSGNTPALQKGNVTTIALEVSPSSPSEQLCEKSATVLFEAKSTNNLDSTTIGEYAIPTRRIIWRPYMLRLGPLAGLAALLFAFLETFAAYAVLKASDGDPVTNWEYQPTVYLAILTATSNKALAFAVVQGTVVTFWLRALSGTTLIQLHRDWAFGKNMSALYLGVKISSFAKFDRNTGLHVVKAMMANRNSNMLALACICATFVAIDGPLLQRASFVRSEIPEQTVSLAVSISPEIPAYSTGWATFTNDYTKHIIDWTGDFLPVVKTDNARLPLQGAVAGCHVTCSAVIHAPALAIDHCVTARTFRNYTEPLSPEEERDWEQTGTTARLAISILCTSMASRWKR